MRAIWTGEINFGMVTIPAKLYSATKDLTPQFNQLHKECGTRISMIRRCQKCERDLAWEEIGKGYEVSDGQYALFTKEELAELEGENAASGIDIVEVIDPKEVDALLIDKSYWVGPGGKSAHSFKLLHATLLETGKAALSKVKIRTRTRLGVLRPKGNLFVIDLLRFGDELVSSEEITVTDNKPVSDKEMILAKMLVERMAATFDSARHVDTYREAVLTAAEGKTTVESGTPNAEKGLKSKLIDLSDLLAASLANPARKFSFDDEK